MKKLDHLKQQLKDSEQRSFDRTRGDELMEQLTRLHVEHQGLQFEHNTLLDLYSREEIEKAATVDLLNDRIKELENEKEEFRVQTQLQNSYLWRLLSVSALATHGKPVDPDDTKASVREHQIEAAVKSLTAFVSSRMHRPPGVVGSDGRGYDDEDDENPATPRSWKTSSESKRGKQGDEKTASSSSFATPDAAAGPTPAHHQHEIVAGTPRPREGKAVERRDPCVRVRASLHTVMRRNEPRVIVGVLRENVDPSHRQRDRSDVQLPQPTPNPSNISNSI